MLLSSRHTFRTEFPVVATPLPASFLPRQAGSDVLSMAGETLRENERLHDLTHDLKQSSDKSEEAEAIIKGMLPTLDGFDRVLHLGRSYPQSDIIDNWLKSVESIYFRLLTMLENYGLFQMHVVGSKVDLNLHEVVEYRPSSNHVNDTVISERQKGYILHGKLLRDAKVVVAYNERSQ